MVPTVFVRSTWNKRCASRILAATFSSASKPLLTQKDVQRSPPASTHRERTSYGINYLETWMGTQKRRPLAPAAAIPTIVPGNVVSSANEPAQLEDPRTRQQLPISLYEVYTLRPNLTTEPESLIESLRNNIVQADQNILNAKIPRTMPIVLDMSDFWLPHHSPPPEGTMEKIVNAILSHANETESNIKFCLVGVTNLPPFELENPSIGMMFEAQSMNLPLLQKATNPNNQLSDIAPPSLYTRESNTERLVTLSQSPQKKKRGGVAPLLRPRRPLMPNKCVAEHTNSSAKYSKTKYIDDTRGSIAEDLNQPNFLAAPFQSEGSHPSTKVHQGSIRSGQLITSDHPNQSLVIIGSINPGGEVWSEGDVFVFGKLRGRVLAGLRGVEGKDGTKREHTITCKNFTHNDVSLQDKSETTQNISREESTLSNAIQGSKIFATSFDPELVCIGDTFTTVDDVNNLGLDGVGPVMVTLDDRSGELTFERFHL